jgi:Flp pilus assembly pilin Flp
MRTFVSHFAKNDGATALEHAVMAGLISGVIITAVSLLGTNTRFMFNFVSNELAAIPLVSAARTQSDGVLQPRLDAKTDKLEGLIVNRKTVESMAR